MKTYMLLGRTGDICNLLPALYHEFKETGERPTLVVSKEFSSILDGVSYVTPLVLDVDFREVDKAIQMVKDEVKVSQVVGNEAVIAQVYKNANLTAPACESFTKESWRLAGHLDSWRLNPPLIIDKRNRMREMLLKEKYLTKKKYALAFTDGHSSPMYCERVVMELASMADVQIIKNPRAEKFHDLIALMESAEWILASDSAPLHLAQAVDVPVIALIADTPSLWHGTAMRHNHYAYVRYGRISQDGHHIARAVAETHHYKSGKFLHVYMDFSRSPSDIKRTEVMLESIKQTRLHRSKPFPFTQSHYAAEGVPSIKVMLRMACLQCRSDDQIIVLTNNDTCFYPDTFALVEKAVKENGSCYSGRIDYEGEPRVVRTREEGSRYDGTDLFAFTRRWWREHQDQYPDMAVGRECWDMVMRYMVQGFGGVDLDYAVYHFRHNSHWINERFQDVDNRKNRKIAREYLRSRGFEIPKELQFTEADETAVQLNR